MKDSCLRYSNNRLASKRSSEPAFPEEMTSREWKLLIEKREILTNYLRGEKNKEMRDDICRQYGWSRPTFFRELARHKNSPRLSASAKIRHKTRKSPKRILPRDEHIIAARRELYFKQNPEGSITGLYEFTKKGFVGDEKGPSHSTVRRRFLELDLREKKRLREGAKSARESFNLIKGHTPKRFVPLERVQIDHTLCDVACVDPIHRMPALRPWITVVVDELTRVVLAFVLSFEYPNRATIAYVLARAVAPKAEWLAGLGIAAAWPFHGKFQRIYTDNAMDFRSDALAYGCREWGLDEPEKRPPGSPQYGGIIERLLGNVMEDTKMLPGKTARSIVRRSKTRRIPGKEEAAMTIHEYEAWLANKFIAYHNTPHATLGIPPAVKWEREVFGYNGSPGSGAPEEVSDPDRFFCDFLEFKGRTLQREGFLWDYIKYCDESLQAHIDTSKGQSFIVRRNPFDISSVRYQNPDDGKYYVVPATNPDFRGWTLWDVREAREYLKKYNIEPCEAEILAARERMDRIVENAKGRARAAQRRARKHSAASLASERAAIPKPKSVAQREEVTSVPFVPLEFSSEVFNAD